LALENPLDWLVLLAFLVTSIVAAALLDRLRREAREAQRRSAEVAQLASLGAEALNAPLADSAVAAVGEVIRRTLGIERAETRPLAVAANGSSGHVASMMATFPDGIRRLIPNGSTCESLEWMEKDPVTSLVVPLRVRERVVGTLELADSRGIRLDRAARRFVDVLAYYAALGAERSRLEAETRDVDALRDADRVKNALLASVSHDLRTPLTSITAFANELSALGDVRAELIAQEAGRLNRMVTDLLDLSRIASGSLSPVVEVVAVDDLISGAVQQVEGALGADRLEVRLGAESPFLTGRFDLTQAIRILVNLIDNAAKYSPPHARIEISVDREHDWILVHVADRGPGVPAGEAERIFAPFYRPAGTLPDRQGGGAGLGLAIARGLAEAQGGSVSHAPREGGGSVFTLRLPAVDVTAS
jgi:two-component system sensor histidine kinase KdpD